MSAVCRGTSISPFTRSQIVQCRVTLQSASQVSQETDAPADADWPRWHVPHLPWLTDQDKRKSTFANEAEKKGNFFFPCLSKFRISRPAKWPLQPTSVTGQLRLQLLRWTITTVYNWLPTQTQHQITSSWPLRWGMSRCVRGIVEITSRLRAEIMLMFHSAASFFFFFRWTKELMGGIGESLIRQKEPEKRRVVGSQEAFLTRSQTLNGLPLKPPPPHRSHSEAPQAPYGTELHGDE